MSFRRSDQHAVALIVLTGGRQFGGMELAGPVYDGEHLATDRGALHMGVEQRQEDADPQSRLGAEAELGEYRAALTPWFF